MESRGTEVHPQWGPRRVILGDLSPAATLHCRQLQPSLRRFASFQRWRRPNYLTGGRRGDRLDVRDAPHGRTDHGADQLHRVERGLFLSGLHGRSGVSWTRLWTRATSRTRSSFPCPHCAATLTKDNLVRLFETLVDPASGQPWKRIRSATRPDRLQQQVTLAMRRSRTLPILKSSTASLVCRCRPRFRPTPSPLTRCTTGRAWRPRGSRMCTTCSCRGRHMRWRRCGGVPVRCGDSPTEERAAVLRRAGDLDPLFVKPLPSDRLLTGQPVPRGRLLCAFTEAQNSVPGMSSDGKVRIASHKAFKATASRADAAMTATADCSANALPDRLHRLRVHRSALR